MKKYIVLFFILSGLSLQAQQQEVRHSIEIFFEGFHQKDTVKIKSVCADKIILQSIRESAVKGNELSNENAE